MISVRLDIDMELLIKIFRENHHPVLTHGTGGLADTIRQLTDALPDDCTVLTSFNVYENDVRNARNDINKWLAGLGY